MTTTGPPGLARVDTEALRRDLAAAVDGEVRFDGGSRGAYATDSSNYRQVPIGIVVPRTVDAGVEAVRVCHEHGAPLLSRGGGTSLGGQATNTAVVLDWTKYCDHLLSVDAQQRTCLVEPGIVLDSLNAELAHQDLAFGPRPSTHSHCALGGMIGNNACGVSAQRYGKTVDNVRSLEVLTYDGLRCWVGPRTEAELADVIARGGRECEVHRRLRDIRDRYCDRIRDRYPAIPRRVSGYNLDALLHEDGIDLAELLVGSEGTLVTVLHAELDLVPTVSREAMVVLGYPDVAAAADDVPRLLDHAQPQQLEALGGELVHFLREERTYLDSVRLLPEGNSWLFVQFGGDSTDDVDRQVRELLDGLGKAQQDTDIAVSDDPAREQQMLKAREAGLGATAHPPDMPES